MKAAVQTSSHDSPSRPRRLHRRVARLRHRSRRAVEVFRYEGVASLMARLVALAGYRRGLVMAMTLERPPPLVEPRLQVEFGLLQPQQLQAFAAYRPDIGAAIAAARLARGERCFIASSAGRIVSARWIATGAVRVPEFRLSLPLGQDEAFWYDEFTSADMRGHRIAAAGVTRTAATLAAEGRRRLCAIVLPENSAGIKTAQRSGYQQVARFAVLVLGPLPALRMPYLGRGRRSAVQPEAPATRRRYSPG